MKTKKSSAKKAKFEDEKSAQQVEDAAAKAVIETAPEPTAPSPSSTLPDKQVTAPEQEPKLQQDEEKKLEQLPEKEAPKEAKEDIPASEPVLESSPTPTESTSTIADSPETIVSEPQNLVVEEKRKRKRKTQSSEIKHDVIEQPKVIEQPASAPAPAPAPSSSIQSNYVVESPTQQLEQVLQPAEEKKSEEEEKSPQSEGEWENGMPSEKPELPEVEEIRIEPTKQKRRGKKRKKQQSKDHPEEGLESRKKGKGKKTDESKTSFSDTLVKIALKYTRAPTRYLANKMPGLRDNLLRSNLRISPEGLIAISLLFTFITVPVSIIGAYILATHGFALEAFAVPAASIVPFFIGISIPKISASSRAQALDNELPYLFAYITVLAGGGINPMVTLKRITKAANIFPASAKEAKRILMDIDIFGLDAISALEREARLTPNKVFSDFIGGYVAVLKTGGDALSFLEAKLKDIFAYREAKIRSSSEFIATMSEAYIITTVVMGVSLMILWATQNLMSPNGLPSSTQSVNSTMIVMFSGFAVPLISLIFIIVIGSSQVREPYSYDLPFYIFLGCIPIGALIYLLPTYYLPVHNLVPIAPYMLLGIGLTVITTPPMVIQMIYRKRKQSVEAKLANFLRDISEVRKTGLAPEKTIEQLSNRNYGGLSIYVKKIAAQVSWGTPLRTVLQNFTKEVKSWVSRAVAFLLLEVVDVGGGSAKMFISLADFTEKNDQLDKAKKSQIRPYIVIPYIGAILVVATTAMMVYYTGFSFTAVQGVPANFQPNPAVLQAATTTLLMAAFFQAWVMGFVAGKMGEGSAADGFKHATLLIVISMITVIVSGFFIKL